MKRIPSLDGFRAISIILVLYCHSRISPVFPVFLANTAKEAAVGVTVFFVISGFLITTLMLIEEKKNGSISIKDFYIRRVFRIIPVYALYCVFILLWRNVEMISVSKANIIHVLTFSVNFDPYKDWAFGHFWSLSTEEQFYIFWPWLFVLFRKHLKIILFILIIYSCMLRIVVYEFRQYQNVLLSPFFSGSDAIFTGVLGGIFLFENPDTCKHKIFRSFAAQIAALSLILLFIYTKQKGLLGFISLPFGNLIISASILFLIFAYIIPSESKIFKLLNHKIIVHIGILSYSIYVWQQFFFSDNTKYAWRNLPLSYLSIYIVSLASYNLWEKPFLKLKKRFSFNKLNPVSR